MFQIYWNVEDASGLETTDASLNITFLVNCVLQTGEGKNNCQACYDGLFWEIGQPGHPGLDECYAPDME